MQSYILTHSKLGKEEHLIVLGAQQKRTLPSASGGMHGTKHDEKLRCELSLRVVEACQ